MIGSGAYGIVYDTEDPNIVEKKIRMEDYKEDGLSSHVIREVSILQACSNFPFVVELKSFELDIKNESISLMFTKYKSDLNVCEAEDLEVLKIVFQILLGLKQVEALEIQHRDLKPQNIFLNSENDVVVGDWGLAIVTHDHLLSVNVQTLYYRAPEILLGAQNYTNAIDVWSLGCMLYELENYGKILFRGADEDEQLSNIFELLGPPNNISSLNILPNIKDSWSHFQKNVIKLEKNFQSNQVWDLFVHMIELDPLKRYTIDQCLEHVCFDEVRCLFQIPNIKTLVYEPHLNFLETHAKINKRMRLILFDWIFEITCKYKTGLSCFFLAMQFLDMYLVTHIQLQTKNFQLVGIVCFQLATKSEDNVQFSCSQWAYFCDNAYTVNEILSTEIEILNALNWNLVAFSSYRYLFKKIGHTQKFVHACCILFLITSQAHQIHPQSIIDYFESKNNELITNILDQTHSNAILEKMKYIYNPKLNIKWNLNIRKDGQSSVPDFLKTSNIK